MRIIRIASGIAAVAALYRPLLRRLLSWGASPSEAGEALPGDELLVDADSVCTRAIDIDAAPKYVFPWLVQMGPGPRGGAYTYDWIENLLGLDMHSVDCVLPEFQQPEVGDTISLGPNHMRLERLEPDYVMAWRSQDGHWVWSFVLRRTGAGTRLISRNRFSLPSAMGRLAMIPMAAASLVMERKMLLGIKQRAERLAADSSARRPTPSRGVQTPAPIV